MNKQLILGACSIIIIVLGAVAWNWLTSSRLILVYWSFFAIDDYNAQFVCVHAFESVTERYAQVMRDDQCPGEMTASFHYPDCRVEGKLWICDTPIFETQEKSTPEEMQIGTKIPF